MPKRALYRALLMLSTLVDDMAEQVLTHKWTNSDRTEAIAVKCQIRNEDRTPNLRNCICNVILLFGSKWCRLHGVSPAVSYDCRSLSFFGDVGDLLHYYEHAGRLAFVERR